MRKTFLKRRVKKCVIISIDLIDALCISCCQFCSGRRNDNTGYKTLRGHSGVSNLSVGVNNSVGRHNFPKFNNSVGDLLTK